MTTATFMPQPYALFGVLVERADEPARFEPALDPIRLVLGSSRDENGGLWPVLSGGPLGPFTDPALNDRPGSGSESGQGVREGRQGQRPHEREHSGPGSG